MDGYLDKTQSNKRGKKSKPVLVEKLSDLMG